MIKGSALALDSPMCWARRGLVERLRPCFNKTKPSSTQCVGHVRVWFDRALTKQSLTRRCSASADDPLGVGGRLLGEGPLRAADGPDSTRAPIGAPPPNPSYAAHTRSGRPGRAREFVGGEPMATAIFICVRISRRTYFTPPPPEVDKLPQWWGELI